MRQVRKLLDGQPHLPFFQIQAGAKFLTQAGRRFSLQELHLSPQLRPSPLASKHLHLKRVSLRFCLRAQQEPAPSVAVAVQHNPRVTSPRLRSRAQRRSAAMAPRGRSAVCKFRSRGSGSAGSSCHLPRGSCAARRFSGRKEVVTPKIWGLPWVRQMETWTKTCGPYPGDVSFWPIPLSVRQTRHQTDSENRAILQLHPICIFVQSRRECCGSASYRH